MSDTAKNAQYSTLSPALAVGDDEPDRNLPLPEEDYVRELN